MNPQLLVAGGINDPSLKHLLNAASESAIPVCPFLVEEASSPEFHWDRETNTLLLMGRVVSPSALFLRRDVFHHSANQEHDRALAWYTALAGWVAANPDVRLLNRPGISSYTNKLWVLELAARSGLNVPKTLVTNNMNRARAVSDELIAKPVAGGGYCHDLESIVEGTETRSGLTASPAIVQQRITGDDIRIYRVGQDYFGFKIKTAEVDYRKSLNHDIAVLAEIPGSTISKLSRLMNKLGLNWGAADFKQCKRTGEWFFLEVNANPMFSVFDAKANGKICDAIFRFCLPSA